MDVLTSTSYTCTYLHKVIKYINTREGTIKIWDFFLSALYNKQFQKDIQFHILLKRLHW